MRLRLLAASLAFAAIGLVSSAASAQCGPRSNIECWATLACNDPASMPGHLDAEVRDACNMQDRDPSQPCTFFFRHNGDYRQILCQEVGTGQ